MLGHGSANAMKFLIDKRIKWPGIYQDIDRLVIQCKTCQKSGEERINSKNKVITAKEPREFWEIDLLGRIPTKDKTSKFIVVAVDQFSKWVETKVVPNKSEKEIIKAIEEMIFKKHGIPKIIYSDNGLEFNNSKVKELVRQKRLQWIYNSPGHHNAIGTVERMNKTLMDKIKKLCNFGELDWEKVVEKATYAINISPSRALGTSPYIMMHQENPTIRIEGHESKPYVNMKKNS